MTDISKAKPYRAFWHLEAIAVLKAQFAGDELTGYQAPVWSAVDGAPKALVALIDTGVDRNHPYLAGRVVDQVDVTTMPKTAAPAAAPSESPFKSVHPDKVGPLDLGDLDASDRAWLERFQRRNSNRFPFDNGAPDTSNRLFSAHGTACAGIVAGATPTEPVADAPAATAYCGVDPTAELLSITTTFAQRPQTLLLAFLLAVGRGADVILLPRGISGALLAESDDDEDDDEDEIATGGQARAWRVLKAVIVAVSKRVPVVCAAGNDGESRLIAPASLGADETNGIIAVGAMGARGVRSSYSTYGAGLSLVGPSDDGEMYTRDQMRLDPADPAFGDHPYAMLAEWDGAVEVDFAQEGVLTIDVPGNFGFAGSSAAEISGFTSLTAYAGAFTLFGGTSAASAIVAGVVALLQRAAKADDGTARDGPAMRKILQDSALKADVPLPHSASGETLAADTINGVELTFEAAFGAGLVNADAALQLMRGGN